MEADPGPGLPLRGVKVLDLTRALAGPFCTMILADLGADVVKVEPVGEGDMVRGWGPFDRGIGVFFLSVNRNKRSLAVDFRDPDGLALLRELALGSDVVVENFKPGTAEAMGLGADALRAERPRLVCTSISGFGATGPYGSWPGLDQIAQGMSGTMSLAGTAETGPFRMGVPIGDLTAGMWAAIGTLGALHEQGRTGRGGRVECSLVGALASLLCVQGQRHLSLGETPPPVGNDHPVISPYGVFRTADGPINLAGANPEMWSRLCRVLGLDGLKSDPRFADNAARVANRAALRTLIEEKLAAKGKLAWTHELMAAGIPAGPIYDLAETFADPQAVQQRLVETVEHPTLGTIPQLASGVRLDAQDGRTVRTAPPRLGEHGPALLAEFGIAPDRIAALVGRGIVAGEAA